MSRLTLSRIAIALVVLTALPCLPAHATSKDMIELQAQVQQLQDSLARLQQSTDKNLGMLQSLVQQTADSVNKMSTQVSAMQLRVENSEGALSTKSDAVAGQVQSLSDSLDEVKARMARMEKTLGDIQSQQQSTAAALAAMAPAAGASGGAPSGGSGQLTGPPPPATSTTSDTPVNGPSQGQPLPAGGAPVNAGPTSGSLYRAAYNDYISGRYPLASSEFDQLIKAYPNDNLSGNAYFYEGEIDMRTGKPSAAVRSYNHLLDQYPDNAKIPAAHLHKAEALISIHQTEAGIRELRALIQRFPASPEAAQARSKLNSLGARR